LITFCAKQVRTTRTFLRDCTVVSPMALLLFGGALEVRHEAGLVTVDGWLRIRAPAPTAVLVKKLRSALDALLERKARLRRPRLLG
jgi:ATP-dependent RNA helicase DHX29